MARYRELRVFFPWIQQRPVPLTQLSLVSRGNEYYLPGSVETLVPLFAETLQRVQLVQDLIGEFETPLILELHLNLWHRITWPAYTLLCDGLSEPTIASRSGPQPLLHPLTQLTPTQHGCQVYTGRLLPRGLSPGCGLKPLPPKPKASRPSIVRQPTPTNHPKGASGISLFPIPTSDNEVLCLPTPNITNSTPSSNTIFHPWK